MMAQKPHPVFLERQAYRRRRMADAVRLLPILGWFLICLPLLWRKGDAGLSTTFVMFYLFAVWVLMAVLSAVISRFLRSGDHEPQRGDE